MSEDTKKDDGSAEVKKSDDKRSELIIDLLGPIVDVSRIPSFKNIPNVRYRDIKEIANIMKWNGEEGWSKESVSDMIISYLDDAFHVPILDIEVLNLLVKAKKCAKIKIISGVESTALFEAAKTAIISYSNELYKHLTRKRDVENPGGESEDSTSFNTSNDFEKLNEKDFVRLNEGEKKKTMKDLVDDERNGIYRIVFSEEKDDIIGKYVVWKWLNSVSSEEPILTLKKKIDKMRQIAKADSELEKLLDGKKKIMIESYRVSDDFEYYVFEKKSREGLKNRIMEIRKILENENDNKKANKPVCIFLAGAPGTGKSCFVKLLAKDLQQGDESYHCTSLSCVAKKEFAKAIEDHIKIAYEKSTEGEGKKNVVAFLDEVDTNVGENTFAYRFLLEAMTGNLTDDKGKLITKKWPEAKNLVWVFAGSAKETREEFIEEFYKHERKVADFFDRIHFYILLPSVQSSGQAILTFLSALDRPEDVKSITLTRGVLYLFGRTLWESARQIRTVCRIAVNKKGFDWNKITLDDFRGINVFMDFVTTLDAVKRLEKCDNGLNLEEEITIKFPG